MKSELYRSSCLYFEKFGGVNFCWENSGGSSCNVFCFEIWGVEVYTFKRVFLEAKNVKISTRIIINCLKKNVKIILFLIAEALIWIV